MDELCCLVDAPGLRISYDPLNEWLYTQWRGRHDIASVKHYAQEIYACLMAQPCTKILSDHSELLGNWEGAAAWMNQQHFERMARQGIAYLAWVYAHDNRDRIAMDRSCFQLAQPVVAIFDDVAAAYAWLRSCLQVQWKSCV